MNAFPIDRVRREFPALSQSHDGRPRVFMDNPAGTQLPRRVVDAVSNTLVDAASNYGGFFENSRNAEAIYASAHGAMADFVNADSPNEIVVAQSMTALTLHVSRSLGRRFAPGDEIIVTRMDHEGNVSPWLLLAEDLDLVVKWLPFNLDTWKIEPEDLQALLGPRTRLLALNYASNLTGSINDAAELVALARSAGAMTYVDAVQLAPHQCIDVRALDCDFLVCSSYKFFGPHLGVLWGRRQLLEEMSAYKVRCAPDASPGKWETGTPQTELLAGLAACVDYYDWLGGEVGEEGLRRTRIGSSLPGRHGPRGTLGDAPDRRHPEHPGHRRSRHRQSQSGGGEGADGVDDPRTRAAAAGGRTPRARRDLRLVRPQLRPGGRQAPRH